MNTVDIVIPVYNDNPYLVRILTSIFNQPLPKGWKVRVYVVDDGSEKPVVLPNIDFEMTLIKLPVNKGRSSACNAGVQAGVSGLVYIVDVDCVLEKKNVLSSHINVILDKGADISCGHIYSNGDNFWSRYQNNVVKRRTVAFKKGDKASHTTANLMLKRKVFETIGGFDESYGQYGFEDKDLLLRLVQQGYRTQSNEDTAIEHNPELSLRVIGNKMEMAGRHGSQLFKSRHAEYYKKGKFHLFDLSDRWFNHIAPLVLKPFLIMLIIGFDFFEKRNMMPYYLGSTVVKFVSGFSYALGTCRAK